MNSDFLNWIKVPMVLSTSPQLIRNIMRDTLFTLENRQMPCFPLLNPEHVGERVVNKSLHKQPFYDSRLSSKQFRVAHMYLTNTHLLNQTQVAIMHVIN